MTDEEILEILDPEQIDEGKKKSLLSEELPKLEKTPSEQVIQGIMRLIRKPTIPEASEGVYDEAVKYLKSICRY